MFMMTDVWLQSQYRLHVGQCRPHIASHFVPKWMGIVDVKAVVTGHMQPLTWINPIQQSGFFSAVPWVSWVDQSV